MILAKKNSKIHLDWLAFVIHRRTVLAIRGKIILLSGTRVIKFHPINTEFKCFKYVGGNQNFDN